jgi:hypothetical protein
MSTCRNTKGGFDDKAANKCHTAARKYFLLGLFQVPTGEDYRQPAHDGDADSGDDAPPPADQRLDKEQAKDAASAIATRLREAKQMFALDLAWEDSKDVRPKLPKVTQDYLQNLYATRRTELDRAA